MFFKEFYSTKSKYFERQKQQHGREAVPTCMPSPVDNTAGDDSATRAKVSRRKKKRSNSLSIAAGVEGDAPTPLELDDFTMYQLPFVHTDDTDMTIGELYKHY